MCGTRVIGGIFVSDYRTASDPNWINKNNIGIIINMSDYDYLSYVPQIRIRMEDTLITDENVDSFLHYFKCGINAIETYSNKTNILVHCSAGVNRSITLIGLYMLYKKYPFNYTISILSNANRRRGVKFLTNPSFRNILYRFSVVQMTNCRNESKENQNLPSLLVH